MLERQQRRVGAAGSLRASNRSNALRAALRGVDYTRGYLLEAPLPAGLVAQLAILQGDIDLLADVVYSEVTLGFQESHGVVALGTLESRLVDPDRWPDPTADELRPAIERLVLERLLAWTPDRDGVIDQGPEKAHAYGKERAERVARHGLWRAE